MKKLLIILVLPLILLIGAAAGAFFFGLIPGFGPQMMAEGDGEMDKAESAKEDVPPAPFAKVSEQSIYYTMDEFVVNLQSQRRKPIFLLLSLSIEVPDEAAQAELQPLEPRIRDSVNIYLSSLTPEDLSGFDGIQTVRKEIWQRLKKIIGEDGPMQNVQISKMTVK